MSNYQSLSSYNDALGGTPKYNGAEYDWEVPDNQVISSPGGISSIHHHPTKGFYGRGNTSGDIYAGQGQRYNSGLYGNLYQEGQMSSETLGMYPKPPDYRYWENQQSQMSQYPHVNPPIQITETQMKMYGNLNPSIHNYNNSYSSNEPLRPDSVGNNISPNNIVHKQMNNMNNMNNVSNGDMVYDGTNKENYSNVDIETNVDTLKPSVNLNKGKKYEEIAHDIDLSIKEKNNKSSLTITTKIPPWVLFLVFLFAFIAFSLWAETGVAFLSQHFHSGGVIPWKRMLVYAIGITLVMAVVMYFLGIPLSAFEDL